MKKKLQYQNVKNATNLILYSSNNNTRFNVTLALMDALKNAIYRSTSAHTKTRQAKTPKFRLCLSDAINPLMMREINFPYILVYACH